MLFFTHKKHPRGASIHEIKESFPLKPSLVNDIATIHLGDSDVTNHILEQNFLKKPPERHRNRLHEWGRNYTSCSL